MKSLRKFVSIFLLICMFINAIQPFALAKSISESEKVNLVKDHMCYSLLKIKGKDILKLVAYVCYNDPDTGKKYPAFCVEPDKDGIGTGAGDSYDVNLSSLDSPVLWRMLYKGYCGSTYQDWGLEYDDDLYYATKVAVHCFAEGVTPNEKYELPHRVGWGQEITLEDVQRRGSKVLNVARSIYNYAMTSNDNYIRATVSVSKNGGLSDLTINNIKYVVQTYSATANKELESYTVTINGFPSGTRILNSSNNDASNMTNSTFKIAIPVSSITNNLRGYINISNAKVKSYPIFYANSGNNDTQNYIITDPAEITTANSILDLDAYKSALKIVKSDAESHKPVVGAVFNVKYSDGTQIGNYKTDSSGSITITKLKPGPVIVTEVSVPDKYIIDSSSKEVILSYNSTSKLEVTNARKKGNIKVVKYDKDNNEIRLKGVEFKLFNETNTEIGTYVTNEQGEIHINNLDIGKYVLKETKTLNGYTLAENVTIVVNHNQTTNVEIDNELEKGQLQVLKLDADHNEIALEGVVFDVLDSNKNVIETITTNKDGIATTSRLPSYNKTYYLREKTTKNEYILDTTLHKFTLIKDKVSSLVLENKHKEGNLQIYKVDKDNNKITIGGITFQLWSEEFNKLVGTYVTDLNGEIKINNLRTGNYILKEMTKKNGYYLAEDMKLEIKWNETNNLIVENELEKGQIKVIKIDKDDHSVRIPNTEFKILDENKNYIETITTNENGEATSSRLPSYNSKYFIIETKANDCYELSDKEFEVGLTVDKTKELEIENKVKSGKIEIIKVDKDNHSIRIPNVKFNIVNTRTGKIVDTITTNEDGIAITKDLSIFDNYMAVEIETDNKYELNTENIDNIILKANETTSITVENERKKGQVRIIKVDADNHEVLLENVKFDILDKDKNYIETIITGQNGEATSSLLPSVDEVYYLKETETNELYELSSDMKTITLKENQIINIIFENYSKVGNLEIIKVDKDNNELPVEGAVFEVIDETTGNVIDTVTTGSDGKIVIEDLKVTRRYTLREIATNKKYNINTEDFTGITIRANETTSITIENEKKKGQIRIIKVDKDNNEVKLQNVVFEILDSNENIIEEIVTNENGEATSSLLPCVDETYFIREKQTLDMYVLNEETKTITLEENQIKDIIFENEKIKGYLEITKVDSKNEDIKLKDAVFGVYNENDELIDTIKTDENGKATILLVKGKYYLKELETGSVYYLLNENTFEFEIVKNKEIVPVMIENEPTDITVDVDKEGTIEVKPGELVDYSFSNIANNSNTYLENFKWFDYIPTDYIRLETMTTGKWNQDLKYSVYYKTNKSEDYILYKENLSTQENYDLDFTTLELAEDEYIIETCFDFGKVDTGFRETVSPTMKCKSLDTLQDTDKFTNHTKTVGVYYGVTAKANSKWTTIVHVPKEHNEPVLPRTGK